MTSATDDVLDAFAGELTMLFQRLADRMDEQAALARADRTLPPETREALAQAHSLAARTYRTCLDETRTALARAQDRAASIRRMTTEARREARRRT